MRFGLLAVVVGLMGLGLVVAGQIRATDRASGNEAVGEGEASGSGGGGGGGGTAHKTLHVTWEDLVGHQERLPPLCKLTAPMELRDGTKLEAGTELCIDNVTKVNAGAFTVPDCIQITVSPEQCDLLEAAGKYLAALTPQQRALRVDMVWGDPTITPGIVTVLTGYKVPKSAANMEGNTIPAGTKVSMGKFENYAVQFNNPVGNGQVLVGHRLTDVLDRARKLFAMPRNSRPGRMNEIFAGRVVDADGKAVEMKPAGFFVLAFLSSADGRSQKFLPKLVERYKSNLADRKGVAVLTISTDKTTEDALKFAKDNGVTWPIVPPNQTPLLLNSLNLKNSPTAVVIVDRFGSAGFSNVSGKYANETPESIMDRFEATLKKPAEAGKESKDAKESGEAKEKEGEKQ